MAARENKTLQHGIILFLAAFVIRFLLPFPEAFSHDELSSLSRTGFNSFTDLLNLGIKIDGHPALIQLLNWILFNNVGMNAVALKLPHIIAGSVSVILIYQIGIKSFNESVGFISAISILALQIFVWNSQIIRPYSFGLMLFLAFLYSLKGGEKKDYIFSAIISGLLMALTAYTHYFSALATLSTAFVFFILFPRLRKYLLWTCGISLVLFLPHVSITWHQLFEFKGIGGWLGKPTPDFLFNYIDYLFHHSKLVKYSYLALGGFGLIMGLKEIRENWMKRLSLLLIFLLHFGILFIYSIAVSPVLQNSALIFVSPLLLLALFSFMPKLDRNLQYILSVVLLSVSCFSLIVERNHHETSKRQPEFQAVKYLETIDFNKTQVITQSPKEYYTVINGTLENVLEFPEQFSTDFLLDNKINELVLIKNRRWLNSLTKDLGYNLLRRENHITQEIYHYSKGEKNINSEIIKKNIDKSLVGYRKDQYLATVGLDLGINKIYYYDFIDAKVSIKSKAKKVEDIGTLVLEIRSESDEKLFWSSASFTYKTSDNSYTQYFSLRLLDLFSTQDELNGKSVVAYFWNEKGIQTEIKNLQLEIVEGNKIFYGLE